MNAEQANAYVGLDWEKDACGPDSYNCWGLLKEVQELYFRKRLPNIVIGDVEGTVAEYESNIKSGAWEIVPRPQHGDAALMRGGLQPHVGVWLDIDGGGILHSMEGAGVIFTHDRSLNHMGFGNVKYYRLHK